MGAGLAKQFKQKYPKMYLKYKDIGGIKEEEFIELFENTFVKQLEDFNIDIYLYKRRNLNE